MPVWLFALLLFATPAFGVTFEVSNTGTDDGACGGNGDECASIQQAADNACNDDGDLEDDIVRVETDLTGSNATLDFGSGEDGCDGADGVPFILEGATGDEILWGGPAVTGWARCDSGSDCDGIIDNGLHDEVWALQVTDDADWDHKRYWLTEADSGSGDGVPTPMFMATTQSITQEVPQNTSNYTTPDSQGTNTITHSSLSSYSNLDTTDALVYIHCCGNVIIIRDITAHSGTTITYEGSNVTANYFEVRNVPEMIDTPGEFGALEESGGNRWVFIYPRNQSSVTSGIHRATEPLAMQLLQFSTGAAYWTVRNINYAGWTIGTQGNSGVIRKGLTGNSVADNFILENVEFRSVREHAARIDPCDNCEANNIHIEGVMISNEQSIPGGLSFMGSSVAPYDRVSTDGWIHDSTFTRIEGTSIPIFANDGLVLSNNKFLGPSGQHGQAVTLYRGQRNILVIDNYFEASERCVVMQDIYGPIWFIGNVCHVDGAVPQSGFRNWGGTTGNSGGSAMYFFTDTDVAGGTEVLTLRKQNGTAQDHGLSDGFATEYSDEGGVEDVGLTDEEVYYVNEISATTISLHTTHADALADMNRVNLTASGSQETHRIASSAGPVRVLWNTVIGDMPVSPAGINTDGGIAIRSTGLPGGDIATEIYCSYAYTVAACGGCPWGEIDDRSCVGDADYNILERGNLTGTCADSSTFDLAPTEGWVLDDEGAIDPEDVILTTDETGNSREDYTHLRGSIADDGCGSDLTSKLPSDTLFDHAGYNDWSAYEVTGTNIGAFPLTDPNVPSAAGAGTAGGSF